MHFCVAVVSALTPWVVQAAPVVSRTVGGRGWTQRQKGGCPRPGERTNIQVEDKKQCVVFFVVVVVRWDIEVETAGIKNQTHVHSDIPH